MVPVRIPIPVLVFLRGYSIDNQISAIITVESSDYIKQCGLSRTTRSEDCHELIIP